MAVIREQRQFGLSPVRVVRAETGGQAVGQALAQAGETFSDIMFRRASVQAEKAGREAALSVEAEKVITFDPVTQKPVALTPPKPFGTIAAEAYQNIINQRFNQEIESDIKLRGTELAIQFKNSANGSELYKQAMNDYVDQLKENAGGMYGEYISGIGNDYTEMTYLNLKENEQARARAQQIAAMNDSNADVIAQVQAAAAQVGAAQAAQMFPETALSLGARAGLTDSSSDSRVREAYRIALAQGGAEYAFNQAVNSGKYKREELQLALAAIGTNSGFNSINIPELKETLAPFVSNHDDWVSVTSPLIDTFNNLLVQEDARVRLRNMAVVSNSTTRPIDLGLDPSGYFTDPQSSIGMVTDAAKSWKAISDQFNRAGAWEQSNPKFVARYDAAQRNYAEAIDASINAYTAALPAGLDGIEEIVKLQTVISNGGIGKENLSEASRTLLSQMEAVDGATGLQDFEVELEKRLAKSKALAGDRAELAEIRAAQAEELERAGFDREYVSAWNSLSSSIKNSDDALMLSAALLSKREDDIDNLPEYLQSFANNIIRLSQKSGSEEYLQKATKYLDDFRIRYDQLEQRRQTKQGEIEAAESFAAAQAQAKNRNQARLLMQETREEMVNISSPEDAKALRESAINGLETLLGGEEDNALFISLKNRIEDLTAEVYIRGILTTAEDSTEFMILRDALSGDAEALKTLIDANNPIADQIKEARQFGSVDYDSFNSGLSRISNDLLERANLIEFQRQNDRDIKRILSGFGDPTSKNEQDLIEQALGEDFINKFMSGDISPELLIALQNTLPTSLINSFNTFENQPFENQLQMLSAYFQVGYIQDKGLLIPSRSAIALDPSAKAYMEGLQDFIESSGAKTREDILFQAEQFRQVRGRDAVEAVNNYYKTNDLKVDGKTYGTISEFIRSRFYQHSLNPRTIQYLEDRFYMSAASHITTGRDLDLNKWSKDMDDWIDKDIVYDSRVWDGGIWPPDFDSSKLYSGQVEDRLVPTFGLGMMPVTTGYREEQLWAKTEFSLVKVLGGREIANTFIDYVSSSVGHGNWVLTPVSTVSTDGGVVYQVLDVSSGRPIRAIARSGGRNEPELISEPIYVSTREAAFIGPKEDVEQRQQAAARMAAPVTPQNQNIIQRTIGGLGAYFGGQSRADQALSESIRDFGNTFSSQIESVGVGDRSVARSLTSGNIGSLDRYRIRLERALTREQEGTPRYNDIQSLLTEIQKINELHGR